MELKERKKERKKKRKFLYIWRRVGLVGRESRFTNGTNGWHGMRNVSGNLYGIWKGREREGQMDGLGMAWYGIVRGLGSVRIGSTLLVQHSSNHSFERGKP